MKSTFMIGERIFYFYFELYNITVKTYQIQIYLLLNWRSNSREVRSEHISKYSRCEYIQFDVYWWTSIEFELNKLNYLWILCRASDRFASFAAGINIHRERHSSWGAVAALESIASIIYQS
jgi:hypothetical protein